MNILLNKLKNDPVAESLSEEEIELANQLQQEISDLDGNELADALVEGKKVLNIMGVDQLIDPETFNQDVSQRIIEINGQINATENETTISKLEEDKSVLTSYLNRFKKPINNFQGPVVEPLPKKEFALWLHHMMKSKSSKNRRFKVSTRRTFNQILKLLVQLIYQLQRKN